MSSLPERIRRGEPLPWPLDAALEAATVAQRLGMWWRRQQRVHRVTARVISYGNIAAGGTGKTPAVIARAQAEIALGRRVAVVTRGYGSERTPEPFLVFPEDRLEGLWKHIGDEPALIRRRVPGAVLVKSADRVAGAEAVIRRANADLIILDDGFQSLSLARDEDWVCIDAVNPFGNHHLIPRGILREPLEELRRATGFVLTRCDQASRTEDVVAEIDAVCPGKPLRLTRHAPTGLWRVGDGAEMGLETLRGAEVCAACAIARPEAFCRTLASLDARVAKHCFYPDHAPIPLHELPRQGLIVVTEKDAVRMHNPPENIYALRTDLQDLDGPPQLAAP